MFSEGRKLQRRASLDLSPLLDVAFQLLIFFAVTTTFLPDAAMQLELPESSTVGPSETSPAVVSVGADGVIQFRGQTLTPDALEEAIAALPADEKARVTVRADTNVGYGVVVRVIDALRRGGVEGLSLPMQAIEGQQRGQDGAGPVPDGGAS